MYVKLWYGVSQDGDVECLNGLPLSKPQSTASGYKVHTCSCSAATRGGGGEEEGAGMEKSRDGEEVEQGWGGGRGGRA